MEDEKIRVDLTEKIVIDDCNDNIEQELNQMSRDELLHRLNYEETNPKIIKLIRKILKTKK